MGKDFKFFIREHPKYEPILDFYFDHHEEIVLPILEVMTGVKKIELEKTLHNDGRYYFNGVTKNHVKGSIVYCMENDLHVWGSVIYSCLPDMDEEKEYIAEIMVF